MNRRAAVMLVVVSAVVGGCATGPGTSQAIGVTPSTLATPLPTVETWVPTPTPKPPVVPTAGVTLVYENDAQVELLTPAGRHVIIDVWDPSGLIPPPTADDILLTTHSHGDHYISEFVKAFPGRTLTFETGHIVLPDVTITSIAAGHNEGDHLHDKDGTDYIFLVVIDGVRIAHFGDLGQERLSDAQMAALGRVDIAISQLDNDMSGMSAANHKGLNQMQQVGPMLFIPTAHISHETMQQAAAAFHTTYTLERSITLTRADLPHATTMLVMGMQARFYGKFLGLKPDDW